MRIGEAHPFEDLDALSECGKLAIYQQHAQLLVVAVGNIAYMVFVHEILGTSEYLHASEGAVGTGEFGHRPLSHGDTIELAPVDMDILTVIAYEIGKGGIVVDRCLVEADMMPADKVPADDSCPWLAEEVAQLLTLVVLTL